MPYFFDDAVRKARKQGYASLTEFEKWDWHADVYGFRRVVLSVAPNDRTSPCDPAGDWFDEQRAAIAEAHYIAKLGRRASQHQPSAAE
jgi:hypothetical protein